LSSVIGDSEDRKITIYQKEVRRKNFYNEEGFQAVYKACYVCPAADMLYNALKAIGKLPRGNLRKQFSPLNSEGLQMMRITQNPVVAIPCGFDSQLRHQEKQEFQRFY
jgi:hypothetical protein